LVYSNIYTGLFKGWWDLPLKLFPAGPTEFRSLLAPM